MDFDWRFWAALFGAAMVRVLTSPFHSVLRAAIQVFVSVFVAWLATDAAVDYLHLNPEVYRVPMGGLIALTADGLVRAALAWAALTADGLVRAALAWAANPSSPLAVFKGRKGGKT